MLRTRKRITRKDIRKPDKFLTFTTWFFGLLRAYRTRIVIVLALLITVGLALWGWNLYRDREEQLAAGRYQTALKAFHEGKYENALDLLAKVQAPRGSIYNDLNMLYRAHSHLALKRPLEAIPLLKELLKRDLDKDYIQQVAFITLGHAQVMTGQCKAAIETFSQAAKHSGPHEEEAILSKGRCQEQTGELTEAVLSYREYLASFPGSARETEVTIRIQKLEEKMGKKPTTSKE